MVLLPVVSVPGVTPVPESGTFNEVLEASLVTAMLPLAAPALFGANVTFTVALWPAVKVIGADRPETLNPVPETAPWLIDTLVLPVFFKTTELLLVPFTCTFPKATLAGVAVRAPTLPVALPDSGIDMLCACVSRLFTR